MRVIIDSSVWSRSFRRQQREADSKVQQFFRLISGDGELFLTGTVLQEVLQAFRSDLQFRKARAYLRPFPVLLLGEEGHVEAAKLSRRCARRGISASTTDCQIAATAIHHQCELLTADTDFERIAEVSTLKLA